MHCKVLLKQYGFFLLAVTLSINKTKVFTSECYITSVFLLCFESFVLAKEMLQEQGTDDPSQSLRAAYVLMTAQERVGNIASAFVCSIAYRCLNPEVSQGMLHGGIAGDRVIYYPTMGILEGFHFSCCRYLKRLGLQARSM